MTKQIFNTGESVPIWAENKNLVGVLTDPSGGIKVTLKDPEGVLGKDYDGSDIDDKAMAKNAVGKYVFYYNSKAATTLASDITATATSITVATGEGVKLPTSNFYIEIDDEILKCTSRTNDVLTVTRGQKGTTAMAHSSGASLWRIKGSWNYFCKAVDGTGDLTKTVITFGSFKLI